MKEIYIAKIPKHERAGRRFIGSTTWTEPTEYLCWQNGRWEHMHKGELGNYFGDESVVDVLLLEITPFTSPLEEELEI